jgi:hypothetical protein
MSSPYFHLTKVMMGTSDYNQKIATLLKDKAYKKLKKNPTDAVEHKTAFS